MCISLPAYLTNDFISPTPPCRLSFILLELIYTMSDTKASETNDLESESLLSPEMKSNINNCDETSPNEKELVAADNDSVKEESSDELPTNGHQTEVNGQTANAEEKTDEGINLEEGSLNDATEKEENNSSAGKEETEFSEKNEEDNSNSVSNEDNFNYEGEYKSQESSMDMGMLR